MYAVSIVILQYFNKQFVCANYRFISLQKLINNLFEKRKPDKRLYNELFKRRYMHNIANTYRY